MQKCHTDGGKKGHAGGRHKDWACDELDSISKAQRQKEVGEGEAEESKVVE